MKIVFTAGGTGGHFYPIVAVAEAIHDIVRERKLIEPTLYYTAPEAYNPETLLANNVTFIPIPAGKIRRYFSIRNIFDMFKTGVGIVRATIQLFFIYPDVVFGKGGYASFPTLVAARLLRIPVVIHESDAAPGRVNAWAGKFAVKVAVSYPEAAKYFPEGKVAFTGNPIRKSALLPARDGAYAYLQLNPEVPVIFVTGGSQGSVAINEVILSALPQLLEHYQVVHQTGEANIKEIEARVKLTMGTSPLLVRYKPYGYLNDLAIRMTAGAAKLVISRAGSTIFEIASWGVPSILVPIPEPIAHDQTKNAFSYARSGAATVIEQNNLTPGLLVSEVERILDNPDIYRTMSHAARAFSRADAARSIAEALLDITLSHEA